MTTSSQGPGLPIITFLSSSWTECEVEREFIVLVTTGGLVNGCGILSRACSEAPPPVVVDDETAAETAEWTRVIRNHQELKLVLSIANRATETCQVFPA